MWLHTIKEGFLYYRFFWNFETKQHSSIALEFKPRKPFGYSFNIDGGEAQVCFSFWLIFQVWITFEGFLPKSWYPTYQSRSHGELPTEREISLRFFDWGLWWTVWTNPGSWSSTDPWWEQGKLDFWKLLFGDFDVERNRLSSTVEVLPFFEGVYLVTVIKNELQIRYRRPYARWLSRIWWQLTGREFIHFEVKGGRQEEGDFKETPVPVPGKGTISYNCGEDAVYSSSFNTSSPDEALFHFWKTVMSQRRRYGGALWTPEETSGAITELGIITNEGGQ